MRRLEQTQNGGLFALGCQILLALLLLRFVLGLYKNGASAWLIEQAMYLSLQILLVALAMGAGLLFYGNRRYRGKCREAERWQRMYLHRGEQQNSACSPLEQTPKIDLAMVSTSMPGSAENDMG